jgi:DNA-directed RNA polymerase subunit RPC12/RpoP
MPIVSRPPEFVVHVRCLHCRHKSLLSNTDLADSGIPPQAPIASFVKRLRCKKCGSGSVLANRIERDQPAARRLRA